MAMHPKRAVCRRSANCAFARMDSLDKVVNGSIERPDAGIPGLYRSALGWTRHSNLLCHQVRADSGLLCVDERDARCWR